MPATTPAPAPAATPTAPWPSLITQFSQPSSCLSIFKPVGASSNSWIDMQNGTRTQIRSTFTSDEADPSFSTCQPPGWEQRHLTFSPGVCPSSWTYWAMTATTDAAGSAAVSQAYCCASGYKLYPFGGQPFCYTATSGDIVTTELQHAPWVVKWQKTDTTTLPVSLPELTKYRSLTNWAPGETLASDAGFQAREGDGLGALGSPAFWAMCLVPPLVFVAAVSWYVSWCVRDERKKRLYEKNKRAYELAHAAASQGGAEQSVQLPADHSKNVEATDRV